MDTRSILFFVFLFSIFVFSVSVYLGFFIGYVGAMHLALFSLGLYLIYDTDLEGFMKKMGIPGDIKRNVIFTVIGLASLFFVLIAMTIAFTFFGLNDQQNVVDIANSLPLPILLLAILFAPFSEEFFFRAMLTSQIERIHDHFKIPNAAVSAIIFSSVIFGLFHFAYNSVVEIVGAFLIGLILALIYKRSGSIIPAIAVHMIYNFASIIVMRGSL